MQIARFNFYPILLLLGLGLFLQFSCTKESDSLLHDSHVQVGDVSQENISEWGSNGEELTDDMSLVADGPSLSCCDIRFQSLVIYAGGGIPGAVTWYYHKNQETIPTDYRVHVKVFNSHGYLHYAGYHHFSPAGCINTYDAHVCPASITFCKQTYRVELALQTKSLKRK